MKFLPIYPVTRLIGSPQTSGHRFTVNHVNLNQSNIFAEQIPPERLPVLEQNFQEVWGEAGGLLATSRACAK